MIACNQIADVNNLQFIYISAVIEISRTSGCH